MSASAPIVIAGGGIGGLALALALARRGLASTVLERQQEFAPAGAGIQIGPNGVRVLRELGVAGALEGFAGKPVAIEVIAGASGRNLARLPLGKWIEDRHGAPYWVAHRGDLHRVLLEAVAAEPAVSIRTGCEVVSVAQSATGVVVDHGSGKTLAGPILIGADGLWSTVRSAVAPHAKAAFAGATATRTVLDARAAPDLLAQPVVGLWLGPDAHVVHYPVRGGAEVAVVVIARAAWQGREWDADADGDALLASLQRSHGVVARALATAAGNVPWRRWALHGMAPLPHWVDGRVALVGDAAHPMLPYLAQGGALALEDAVVLARCLAAAAPRDLRCGLIRYQEQRLARARRVQSASLNQGRIYRLPAPLSWARDTVLGVVPGETLMRRLDWLYAWRPPE
jgi:salicylate hydroxylase